MSKIDNAVVRHKCSERGCYLETTHPPIHLFANSLPRNIRFSDIDAVADVDGRILFLEWKEGVRGDLPTGQRLLAENLTRISPKIRFAFVFWGTTVTDVRAIITVRNGVCGEIETCDLDGLNQRIAAWALAADARKAAA